jgi:hypothetical protein
MMEQSLKHVLIMRVQILGQCLVAYNSDFLCERGREDYCSHGT